MAKSLVGGSGGGARYSKIRIWSAAAAAECRRWPRVWLGVVAAACHPAPSVWWEVAVAGCRPAPDAWWEVAVAACHPAPSVWWEVGAAGCHRGGLRAERQRGGSRQRRTDHGPARPG